jgi:hypothetical protein
MGGNESEHQNELNGTSATKKRSPKRASASFTAVAHDGELWESSYRLQNDELNGSRGAQDQPKSDELMNWVNGDWR